MIYNKLPRKLKKGYKNVWRTRREILSRIEYVKTLRQKAVARLKIDYDVRLAFLQLELRHPYPETKWTRKANAKIASYHNRVKTIREEIEQRAADTPEGQPVDISMKEASILQHDLFVMQFEQ